MKVNGHGKKSIRRNEHVCSFIIYEKYKFGRNLELNIYVDNYILIFNEGIFITCYNSPFQCVTSEKLWVLCKTVCDNWPCDSMGKLFTKYHFIKWDMPLNSLCFPYCYGLQLYIHYGYILDILDPDLKNYK